MGSDVQKWADKAMYTQDEIVPEEGPRVSLLWMTPDPLGAAAAMNGMYPGPRHNVARSLADVTRADREAILEDMQKTVLAVPLEAISFHFVIEGVTRAFTHQLVRNRNSGFAQESMRFAVVGDGTNGIPVMTPPSFAGVDLRRDVTNTTDPSYYNLSKEEKAYLAWDDAIRDLGKVYKRLVALGMPAEDARGILPTNTLTRIQWVVNLRSLQLEFSKRLTTQAQFEWRRIVALCAQAIRQYQPHAALNRMFADEMSDHMKPDVTEGMRITAEFLDTHDRWQFEAISDLFRPICYKTGKCEFMGEADRFCSIRERVEQNHAAGRPSSEWHLPLEYHGGDGPAWTGPVGKIEPILPHEWLSDATAARRAE